MKLVHLASSVAKALRGDRDSRFSLAEQIDLRMNPEHFFGEDLKDWMVLAKQRIDENQFGRWALHRRWDRLWTLHELARSVRFLDGATAEMGVFTGATSFMVLTALAESDQQHWGFDSFEGLSEPEPSVDGTAWKRADLTASQTVAAANLSSFGDRVQLRKGWIPEVFDTVRNEQISLRLTHIDVDLYAPTLAAMEWAVERTVAGGLIVCDDYGFSSCPGPRKAFDDFALANPRWTLMHLTSGQGVLIAPQQP